MRDILELVHLIKGIYMCLLIMPIGLDDWPKPPNPQPATAPPAQATPVHPRVFVLDTSGSMLGERLQQAQTEIAEFARQLPPSPRYPIVLVPFDSAAHDVATFHDPKSFTAALTGLKAQGGTSIAAGLRQALIEMEKYPSVPHVSVFLYTDGDDRDAAGIRQQEEKLDGLFAARSRHGLNQSVVFCKRWQKANAELLENLRKRGHATIVDAGEFGLTPVTLTPSLAVAASRRLADRPNWIEVDLQATIAMQGVSANVKLAPVRWRCTTAGVEGTTAFEVLADGTSKAVTLRFERIAERVLDRDAELAFEILRPAETIVDKKFLIPVLPVDRLSVRVPIPASTMPCVLRATLRANGAASWDDALAGRAIFPITLAVQAETSLSLPWDGALELHVQPQGSARLDGPRLLRIERSGTVETPLRLVGPAERGKPTLLSFSLAPRTIPSSLTGVPAMLPVSLEMPGPAAVETTIQLTAHASEPARWIDLAAGLAAFTVPVEYRVDGPIEPNTQLVVISPPGVRQVRFRPNTFTTGTQVIHYDVEAVLPAEPATRDFTFTFDPPKSQGAVTIRPPKPLTVRAVGPKPVPLALTMGGTPRPVLDLRGCDDRATSRLTPTLVGWNGGAAGLRCKVILSPPLEAGRLDDLVVEAPLNLHVRAPGEGLSFFRDRVVEAAVRVEPTVRSAAVCGSQQLVRLRMEAPFKRVLFYLAAAVSGIVAVCLIVRMAMRPKGRFQ